MKSYICEFFDSRTGRFISVLLSKKVVIVNNKIYIFATTGRMKILKDALKHLPFKKTGVKISNKIVVKYKKYELQGVAGCYTLIVHI